MLSRYYDFGHMDFHKILTHTPNIKKTFATHAHLKRLTAACYINVLKISEIFNSRDMQDLDIANIRLDYCHAALVGTNRNLQVNCRQYRTCRVH